MAQIRGTAGYNLGGSGPQSGGFGGGGYGGAMKQEATNDPSPLDAIREQTSKIEDMLDTYSEPIKPYVLQIARNGNLLIVDLGIYPRSAASSLW